MKGFITKSDIKRAIQCLKHAYLAKYNPELSTPIDQYQQVIIDRGFAVELQARKEIEATHTSLLLLDKTKNAEELFEISKTAFKDKKTQAFFEPTIVFENILVRCDILVRNKTKFDLIEIKSGSSLDEEYVLDLAIQSYVLEKAGIKLKDSSLWHINKTCELPDLTHLFAKHTLNEEIKSHYPLIEKTIASLTKLFQEEKKPEIKIGDFCSKPFECPFKDHCFSLEKIPDIRVFNIPRLGGRAWMMFEQGIVDIKDVDISKNKFTDIQKRMILSSQSGELFLDKEKIKNELQDWVFPLYLIDFEGMEYDLPGLPDTRPGIHIAFQLSIKKIASPNSPVEHVDHFLMDSGDDPRFVLTDFMIKHLGETGSIVAYSQGYEKGKILDIVRVLKDESKKEKMLSFVNRLVDPLPVFRDAVYHPQFKGSFSIKKVGPALLGEDSSYKKLNVQDGTQAVVTFKKMIAETDPVLKQNLYNDLVAYCDQDTFVMGLLVNWLYSQILE